jgi:hypothetical protein
MSSNAGLVRSLQRFARRPVFAAWLRSPSRQEAPRMADGLAMIHIKMDIRQRIARCI